MIKKIVCIIMFIGFHASLAQDKQPGTMIVVRSAGSNGGKTTTLKACEQIKPHWEYMYDDELYYGALLDEIKEQFGRKYDCIKDVIAEENILHAIWFYQILFKKEAHENQKKQALKAIHHIRSKLDADRTSINKRREKVCEGLKAHIIDMLGKGKTIINEGAYILYPKNWDEIKRYGSIASVLVYCSLEEHLKRVQARFDRAQETGNVIKGRAHHRFALNEFLKYFESCDSNDPTAIAILSKTEVSRAFDFVKHCIKDRPVIAERAFTLSELSLDELAQLKRIFFAWFKETDKVGIKPKKTYDFVLRTDRMPPEQCAQKLIDFIETYQLNEQNKR